MLPIALQVEISSHYWKRVHTSKLYIEFRGVDPATTREEILSHLEMSVINSKTGNTNVDKALVALIPTTTGLTAHVFFTTRTKQNYYSARKIQNICPSAKEFLLYREFSPVFITDALWRLDGSAIALRLERLPLCRNVVRY
ncbi:hypothetical protein RCL1_008966 [Eukaryota sp. TZLM3-RCL]